jgi:tetratricopeptide (TPR) repeat protein
VKKRWRKQNPGVVLLAASLITLSPSLPAFCDEAASTPASDNKEAAAAAAQTEQTQGASDQKTQVSPQGSAFDLIRKPTQNELDAIQAMQQIRENDAKKAEEAAAAAAKKAEEAKKPAKKPDKTKGSAAKKKRPVKKSEPQPEVTKSAPESKPDTAKPAETPAATAPAGSGDDAAYHDALKNGETAYRQKDYDNADKALKQALDEAEKFAEDDKRVPPVLDYMALVASMRKDYKGAIDLQKRAQSVNTKVYGGNSKQVSYDLQHLSLWYEANKQPADADAAYKQSVDVMEKAVGKDDPALAKVLCGLAEYDMKRNRIADATVAYKRALDIFAKIGSTGEEIPTFNKLLKIEEQQNKSAEIDKLCQEEIDNESKQLGGDSSTLSMTLCTVGDMYMEHGHAGQAEPLYRRAVSIQRTVMGEDHPITASTSYSLALALCKEGKYYDADPLFKLAIRVLSKTKQREVVPGIMQDYADCLTRLGRRAEAANMKAQAASFGH